MNNIVFLWLVLLAESIVAQNCQQTGCSPGFCCSKWGFCGNSPLHCQGNQPNNTQDAVGCDPPCQAGFCCSKWGFCGNTPLHCQGNQVNNNTNTVSCNPPCQPGFCCSKWGFCGNTPLHCASNTTTTIATTATAATTRFPSVISTTTLPLIDPPADQETTMTRKRFDCIFDQINANLRDKRWQGYQDALSLISFKPQNQNELMMFFAHVAHETDGLQTYEEYCGKAGTCADDYQRSWCSPIQAASGKKYYGRGWFQLSWPCNYNAAGRALGIDFLKTPEKVAESDAFAAATAIWFWKENNMSQSARNGNFGETTKKINSIECGGTPQQTNRIERYQKVRQCFGLSRATTNLRC